MISCMPRTYADDADFWRRYQEHLPPEVRIEPGHEPREEHRPWRGGALHLDRFAVPDAAVTVVVVHGGGGYGRMLAPIGRVLHEHGAEVVLPDLPGYGLTDVAPAQVRYGAWVDVLLEVVAAERAGGRLVVLFGLSMGGMLALHAAAAAPAGHVAGVVATTLMDPRDPAVRRGAGRFPTPGVALRSAALDRVRLPMPLLAPIERMSSVGAINRLCRRDPQGGGGRVPLGLLRSWMTYVPAIEPSAFTACPVLLLHPLADRWTPPAWSTAVLDRIPAPTRYVGLDACEHWPIEQPGLTTLTEELGAFLAGRQK